MTWKLELCWTQNGYGLYIYIYIYLFIKFPPDLCGRGCYLSFVACLASRNVAICCILPLEPGPEPLFAAYGRSSLAQRRRWLEMAARARPGGADGSKWPLESALEPQNARRVLLESAPEPQNARQVPLEPPRRRRMLDGGHFPKLIFAEGRSTRSPWCQGRSKSQFETIL